MSLPLLLQSPAGSLIVFKIRDQQGKDSGLIKLIRGEPRLSYKKPDPVAVLFVCVLCGLSLSHRANGSPGKKWGSSKHARVLETSLPFPSPQPPVPPQNLQWALRQRQTKPLLYMPLLKP